MILVNWFLFLIVYSVFGWVYESIICSIREKKLVNRGFLNSPVCPVYGFGSLLLILLLEQRTDNFIILFFAGMLITCTVEYTTGALLEKLFHAKWWDYSHHRFNIHGRVCLFVAVIFGTMSVLLIKYIHPSIRNMIDQWPQELQIGLSLVLFIILILDLYMTVSHLLVLKGRLHEIQSAIDAFLEQQTKRAGEIRNSLLEKLEESEYYNEHIKSLLNLNRIQNIRIIRSCTKLRFTKYEDAWQKLKCTILGTESKH